MGEVHPGTIRLQLIPQQIYNANVYLCNSALFLAEASQKTLEKLSGDEALLPKYSTSSLYKTINRNNHYLRETAYTIRENGLSSRVR
ncbi:hypothetical protein [Bacillus sp. EB01]|uniref:hypothetical protein n=1 Tax=Bacillus sp. EB01 TaxID=1347086 RepID=UPI0005C4BA64|nr:hypothetical protein [Bacillus sp. EB01]